MSSTTIITAVLLFAALAGCGSSEGTAGDAGSDAGSIPPCDGKDAGETCTDGFCWKAGSDKIGCYSTCSRAGDPCDAGTCFTLENPSQLACLPTGCEGVGCVTSPCDKCDAGAQCLDHDGTMNCYQVCAEDAQCDVGGCIDTELGFSVCFESAVGDVCYSATSCVPNAACVERTGVKRCYQVCDEGAPCPSGTCTDTELGFSVCVAETP